MNPNQPKFFSNYEKAVLVGLQEVQTSFQINPKCFQKVATEFQKSLIKWDFY